MASKWYKPLLMSQALRAGWRHRLALRGWLLPVAAGIFVFGLGQELWFRYLPEYLRFLGASALTVGAFGALSDLLDAAYAYPGGWLSDRWGSRRSLLFFGALTALGFVVYLLWHSIAGIFLGLLLVMAWKSLGLPATFALVGEELAGSRRIVGFTVQSVLRRIPIVIAPPLGGLLLERLGMARGMRTSFAISIALSLAMLLALHLAFRRRSSPLPPLPPGEGRGEEFQSESRRGRSPAPAQELPLPPGEGRGEGGTHATTLHPTLKRLLVADCLIRLCEGLPDVFLVVWALEVLRISPSQFGLATSVLMGTSILSYLPAAALADRIEKKPFVIATFLFFTLFPIAVLLSRSFVQLLGAYVVGGMREIGEPARKALIVDLSPLEARGRTVGLYYSIRGFTVAGAALVGGALWTIRPSLTFLAAALLGLAGTLWAAVALPSRPEAVLEATR
jgi:MFS family permease